MSDLVDRDDVQGQGSEIEDLQSAQQDAGTGNEQDSSGAQGGADQQNAQLSESSSVGLDFDPDMATDAGGGEEEAAGPGYFPVTEGATFASIAEQILGDPGQASVIAELNPEVDDPNDLSGKLFVKVPNAEQIAQFREARQMESQKDAPPPPVEVPESQIEDDGSDVTPPVVDESALENGDADIEIELDESDLEEVDGVPELNHELTGGGEVSEGGNLPFPIVDATIAQDNTNVAPIPLTTENSTTVTAAAEQTTSKDPKVANPEMTTGQKVTKGLHDAFFGPWSAALTPFGLGGRGQARAAELGKGIGDSWNKIGQGDNAFAHIRDVLDLVYKVCDGVTGFTGPLGTILGIASYIRYIPFPATMAIGNWMKLVAEFLNALTFILDIVKLVTGGLKVTFGALAVHFTRDPELRAKYREALISDVEGVISDGFAVGFTVATGGHKTGVSDSWKNAAKGNKIAGTFSGAKNAVWNETTSGIIGGQLLSQVNRTPYYREILNHAVRSEAPGIIGNVVNEGLVKPYVAPAVAPHIADGAVAAAPVGLGAAGVAAAMLGGPVVVPAALATGAFASRNVGMSAVIRGLQQRSRQELVQAGESSTTPVTDAPLPPATVTHSPLQLGPIAEEKEVLKGTEEDLLQQKEFAEAGAAEKQAWIEGANEHLDGLQGEKAAVEGAAEQTTKDKQELAEGKAETNKGKAESGKGSSKAKESENGPGGAPGNASTDVPWYKKPFVWVIRKLNDAKAKVMDGITKAIMKALENILNFDQIDEQLEAADEVIGQEEAVVNEEPAALSSVSASLSKEEADTNAAKAEAEQQKAENEEIKAAAEADYEAVKAQREAVEAEEEAIKADDEAYKAQYGGTFEEMKLLAAEQEKGEVAPLRLQLDARRATLEEMLNTLASGLSGHQGTMLELVYALKNESNEKVMEALPSRPAGLEEVKGAFVQVEDEVKGDIETGVGGRGAVIADLRARVAAVFSGEVTTETLDLINQLEADIVDFALSMEETEQTELDAIHQSFSETYDGFVTSLVA